MALPIHSNQALLEWLRGKSGSYCYLEGGTCLLGLYYRSKYGERAGVDSTHVYSSWSGKGGGARLPTGWNDLAVNTPWTFEAARERLERLMAG